MVHGPWLALAVIAGQASGILLGNRGYRHGGGLAKFTAELIS
jgi:hypothetical protein